VRHNLTTGYNVDPVHIPTGIQTLADCGYTESRTVVVITYALQRWARGEEEQAQRMAIDPDFYGIDLTSWLRVLAAAIEAGRNL